MVLFIVGNYDELRFFRKFADNFIELIDVGIVKRCIYLIKYAEGCRFK